MSPIYLILTVVLAERLLELAISARNSRWLLAKGATEIGARHYPLFFLLHGSWFAAIIYAVPANQPVSWWLITIFIVLQLGRIWILAALGNYWSTRIYTLPDQPLIVKGPYRWLRHPNYLIVALEIPLLPLAFGAWKVATVWSVLNAVLLAYRISIEETTLAPRRAPFVSAGK